MTHHPCKWAALIAVALFVTGFSGAAIPAEDGIQRSAQHDFRLVIVTEGLEHPWSMAFLPDGNILVAGGDIQNQVTTIPQRFGVVKWTDIFDPRTNRWRRVADLLQFREYHAVTILVPSKLKATPLILPPG